MTINVYSIRKKQKAVEQYLRDSRVHIAVITETHVQEGDSKSIEIKGYKLASSCQRKQGEINGGIAIYAHENIAHTKGGNRITQMKNEREFCPAVIYPNHNERDQLAIVGVYRPPEKEHPEYKPILDQMLQHYREKNITTVLMGDFNINSWAKKWKKEFTKNG